MGHFYKFLVRILVYQVIFVSIFHNLKDLQKNAYEFKDKYYSLERWIKHKTKISTLPFLEELVSNKPILVYQLYIAKTGIFALLGLLGFKIGAYFSVLMWIFQMMLFPIRHSSYVLSYPYAINIDLVISIGYIIALLMTTTSFNDDCGESCGSEATNKVDAHDSTPIQESIGDEHGKKAHGSEGKKKGKKAI